MPPHFVCSGFSIVLVTKAGQDLRLLRARFYRSTKFRCSLILSLRESCWGVPSPNPAYAAFAAYPYRCHAANDMKHCFRFFLFWLTFFETFYQPNVKRLYSFGYFCIVTLLRNEYEKRAVNSGEEKIDIPCGVDGKECLSWLRLR